MSKQTEPEPIPSKRIFLSSTAEDLTEHRVRVSNAINLLGQTPVRMEDFVAGPNPPLSECQDLVKSCDALVVIVAHRYGWVPAKDEGGDGEKSITWHEVAAAKKESLPIFAFLVDGTFPWAFSKEQDRIVSDQSVEELMSAGQAVKNLQEFKAYLSKWWTIKKFDKPLDLALKVTTSLSKWLLSQDRPVPSKTPDDAPTQIEPKGLRAFDERDKKFFLRLLPGRPEGGGLPKSIEFWKQRIDLGDEDLRVGLIWGPSGCGKTSFVRAGLIPVLGKHVVPVYLDAAGEELEQRLLAKLLKSCPGLSENDNLVSLLADISASHPDRNKKHIVIILDQFEEWLSDASEIEIARVAEALKHCDGRNLQCLMVVRGELVSALDSFGDQLGIDLMSDERARQVKRFDKQHARQVLGEFGQVLRKGSEDGHDPRVFDAFVQQAVDELADNDEVVALHLAMFAHMMKDRDWSLDNLKSLGGTEGIGATFLENVISPKSNYLKLRGHYKAAEWILNALLPDAITDTMTATRSREDLLRTSGYADDTSKFDEVLKVLDEEVRLITPNDAEAHNVSGTREQHSEVRTKNYQLTHDYLVLSIREWQTRKKERLMETKAGRPQVQLGELSALWNKNPDSRRLPGLVEWIQIRRHTRRADWSPDERRMMKAADRRILFRTARVSAVLLALGFTVLFVQRQFRAQKVSLQVDKLLAAVTSEVPGIIAELRDTSRISESLLWQAYPRRGEAPQGRLNASLALLAIGTADTRTTELLDYVYERLKDEEPGGVREILESLLQPDVRDGLLDRVRIDFEVNADKALPLASILAACAENEIWPEQMPRIVANQLVDAPTGSAGGWRENLGNVRQRLRGPLKEIYLDHQSTPKQRLAAGDLLVAYAPIEDRIGFLVEVLPDSADAAQFQRIVEKLATDPGSAIEKLAEKLESLDKLSEGKRGAEREASGLKQMHVVAAIMKLGGTAEIWKNFKHSEDPTLRSLLVRHLSSLGVPPSSLNNGLAEEDVTVRRALCLALAEYDKSQIAASQVSELAEKLKSFKQHADAGLHSAADFLLRRWQIEDEGHNRSRQRATTELDRVSPTWYRSPRGHEFVAVRGPVRFTMGSPDDDPDREWALGKSTETQHEMKIPRSFAIATKEVTVTEFIAAWRQFRPQHGEFALQMELKSGERRVYLDNLGAPHTSELRVAPNIDCPINGVSWFHAAAYCNWLSEQEGIPRDQWCYDPDQEFRDGMRLPPDCLQRTGYRLPTEAEWEYACRAGSTTSRFYGEGESLLSSYAWYLTSSQRISWSVGLLKPNDFGLFDMLGNIEEWCQDEVRSYTDGSTVDEEAEGDDLRVDAQVNRVHRGGSFEYVTHRVRSAARDRSDPDYGYYQLGFRVARTLPDKVDP